MVNGEGGHNTQHTIKLCNETVMPVGRALFKITVIKVDFEVVNQGHCCMNVLSLTDILGYNHVFIHIQLSLLQITLNDLHVTDHVVEDVNKLKC